MATVAKKTTTPTKTATKTATPKASTASSSDATTNDDHDVLGGAFAFSGAAKEQYETLAKAFSDNAGEFQGKTQEFLDASKESFEVMQSHMRDAGTGMITAAREDIEDAVDFANELSSAKSVTEAFDIQRDYWTRYFETRVSRARTMFSDGTTAIRETAEPIQQVASSTFGDSPMASMTNFFPFAKK
ncbi:MAG: phasin family protein [Pseudomonadota bacterium]